MTCIIGLTKNNYMYMGADSGSFNRLKVYQKTFPKIFTKNDLFMFGVSPDIRISQIIKYEILINQSSYEEFDLKEKEQSYKYLIKVLIPLIKDKLIEEKIVRIKDEIVDTGSRILVGIKGNLFIIECDFGVTCIPDAYLAIGAGEEFAIGAMATNEYLGHPRKRIEQALAVAEKYNSGVRKPFIIESLEI